MDNAPDPEPLKQEARRLAASLAPELFALCRALHDDPELSLEEFRASRRLTEALSAEGYRVATGVAGLPTSFVATSDGGRPGPRVAILAEYDALPEIGHGCGHNLIAAAALGTGRVLARLRERIPGEIAVVGTPAEETVGGKAVMAKQGVFDGFDAAMMVHPGTEFRVHTTSLACQSIEVAYEGKASHAVTAPDRGIHALDPLVQLYTAIDSLRKGLGREVRIPGVITEGGRRANVIPERASGRWSIRARNREAVEEILVRIGRLAESLAAAYGARVRLTRIDEPYDEMRTNPVLADLFKRNLADLGVETVDTPRERMGSLDMGNVSCAVPALHAYVGIVPETGALHTREFAEATVSREGERGLLLAVQALAMTAIDLMTDPEQVDAARRLFEAARPRGRA
jgi:amidohydrolase